MRGLILKATPDQDLYVVWSSNVEAPIWLGSRVELLTALWREYNIEHEHCTPKPGYGPDGRVARADDTGTSSIDGDYGWDSPGLVFEQRGILPRHLAGVLTQRVVAGADVTGLLLPFDDENEVRPA